MANGITTRPAYSCPNWLVWGLFGMVVVLSVMNAYLGWVIADQMEQIRAFYDFSPRP